MEQRSDGHDGWMARLAMGVGPASLTAGARQAHVGGGPGRVAEVIGIAEMIPFAEVLAPPAGPARTEPIAVLLSGLRRRDWRTVDSPVTAQRIAARAEAVVLVSDPAHLGPVAALASRLVDRGVRCWVSADADRVYPRAAAAGSALGWGLTPS
jgi:hypothetical protein